jgi:MFS family permease
MSYFAFIRAEYRFLLFGFLMMGLSNFGQTFFISLYSAYFRDTFTLTNTQFGGIYSGVTLASAVCLLYSGKLIDRWRLPVFAGATLVGLALACLITFLADELWMLALGLFMLRHFGQGLSSHTGMTATGRAYEKNRGRATALVQLGYAGFEGFFPVMAITLMALFGWQQSWLVFGLFLALVALPLLVFLSRFEPLPKETADDEPTASVDRAHVLRDRRFYLVLPLYVAPPFLLTGMFFHQIVLADERGWSLALLAGAFSLYAGMKIAASLVSGIVVDRITALRALPFSATPLILAFASLLLPPDTFGIYAPLVYLGLCGLNLGMIGPVSGGLWPELFGTMHLGAIRSLTSPIAIFATAAAPVLFGAIIDAGFDFRAIAFCCVGFVSLAALLAFAAGRDTLSNSLGGDTHD